MKQEIRNMGQTIAQTWVEEGIEKGRLLGLLEQGRLNVERIGRKRLGEPSFESLELLRSIDDVKHLDRLLDRVLDVSTWDELLATDKPNS